MLGNDNAPVLRHCLLGHEFKPHAEDIARKAMKIAAEICIYTNESVTLEKIEA